MATHTDTNSTTPNEKSAQSGQTQTAAQRQAPSGTSQPVTFRFQDYASI
ncbi:hypothetical protein [Loktanella sp. 3ANDIMAR09]|nr:hypothetical protein [Loktanella sp. 3ANDIMAR09]